MSDYISNHGKVEVLEASPTYNAQLDQLDFLATMMDNAFFIPGTNIRFGLDSIIGLVPVLGDTITVAVSAFIISHAKHLDMPKHKIWHMRFNIFMDWLIGCVPLIGDLFDVGWKANRRNVKIMRDHVEKQNIV